MHKGNLYLPVRNWAKITSITGTVVGAKAARGCSAYEQSLQCENTNYCSTLNTENTHSYNVTQINIKKNKFLLRSVFRKAYSSCIYQLCSLIRHCVVRKNTVLGKLTGNWSNRKGVLPHENCISFEVAMPQVAMLTKCIILKSIRRLQTSCCHNASEEVGATL